MAALLLISASCSVWANPLEFTLHKLESDNPGPTLLIIGGIQGDEPGGFTAASMLVTDYKVSKGQIWVVPNLNFESIIKRSRGVHGDMNRKFSTIPSSDPEFQSKYNALEVTCQAMEGSEQRVLNQLDAGETPGTVSSVLNAISSETLQRADELCVEVAAHYGMPYQPGALEVGGPEAIGAEIYLTAMPSFLNNRMRTIAGGSAEVQRNIVAKAILQL